MRMIIRNLAICNYHDSSDDIRYHSSINNSTCINVMMINITTIKIIILRMLALIMIMTIMIMTIITWYWHVHPKWCWQWFSLSLSIYIYIYTWLIEVKVVVLPSKAWMYLQPIFDSPDIMKQLPTEGLRCDVVFGVQSFELCVTCFKLALCEARSSVWSTASGARPVLWWTLVV